MYSPKVDERLIPELYRLKQTTKKPMTHLVNEAIREYLNKRKEVLFINGSQINHTTKTMRGVQA